MDKRLQRFARQYVLALKEYLANENEAGLEAAYRLGRQAIAARLGVLDMARLHQNSLDSALTEKSRQSKAAETFFLEALSPFEVTHRGFREANIRLAQLIETLEKRNSDLAALSNQILHIQEEERKHISRELNDDVGQALAAISVVLAGLKSDGAAESKNFRKKHNEAQQLLSAAMEAIHNFARELRPPMLDELGLLPALRSMVKLFTERTGVRVSLHGDSAVEELTGAQKTVLFRVAQESLTNVARHAKATGAEIAIRKRSQGICMTIEDNGKAFQPATDGLEGANPQLGLFGMQERVRLIKGEFSTTTRPNGGTIIRVVIPPVDKSRHDSSVGQRIAKRTSSS